MCAFSLVTIGMRFAAWSCLGPILLVAAAAPIARGADVISNGPVSFVTGEDAINPRPGTQGAGNAFNSLFYIRPGENEASEACPPRPTPTPPCRPSDPCGPCIQQYPHQPYAIAYGPTAGPVQSNDWWPGVGLQWYVPQTNIGWVDGWDPSNNKPRTAQFISEPFAYEFVDFPAALTAVSCSPRTRQW